MGNFTLFSSPASSLAGHVDALMLFIFLVAVGFAVLVAGLVVFFSIKYHHSRAADRSNPVSSHLQLELFWTGVPLLLALVMFFWGAHVYVHMRQPPSDAREIYVVGKQWMWKIQHLEGRREINELHVPVGRPIKLIMTSEDVIHDFFIPAFRIKQDVLPGRYTSEWFEAKHPGTYWFFCAQYCGTQHSKMIGQVIAMPPADYERWLNGPIMAPSAVESGGPGGTSRASGPTLNPAMVVAGEKLFTEFQCTGCHKPEGNGRGPALVGVFGNTVTLEGGKTIQADETYIRESILQPKAKIVQGYRPVMPTYEGQLEENELMQLIAYVKSLGNAAPVVNKPPKEDKAQEMP